MKAVILVGGQGTRLLPLTCNTPKAMVPVLNTPFLEHVICYLSSHQIKDVVLALSHLSQAIESYFGNGRRFGTNISYAVEDTPLGTAGAVKNAEKYLDETFLVLNGDVFTDLDITAMLGLHRKRKAKVTIALTPVEDPTSYGLIETDARGRVTRFLEKPERSQVTTNTINAGTYAIEPDVLKLIPPHTKYSIERQLFPTLLERGEPIYAYPSSAYWIDIGTPQKYLQLHKDLLGGKSCRYTPAPGKERLIGDQCRIHPTAQLKGPVLIGGNCSIGRNVRLTGPSAIGADCTILEDAVIEESVIWHNVRIGQRVKLKNAIIANNCWLHDDSSIEDSILSDNITVVSGCKLEANSEIWPGTIVEPQK